MSIADKLFFATSVPDGDGVVVVSSSTDCGVGESFFFGPRSHGIFFCRHRLQGVAESHLVFVLAQFRHAFCVRGLTPITSW